MASESLPFEIVATPTETWLRRELARCRNKFLAASPYVGRHFLQITGMLPPSVEKTLVTSTNLRDFAMGASDIDALCELASGGTRVLSLNRLHAKTYVIDDCAALVTSANATFGGMQRNIECGIAVNASSAVVDLGRRLLAGFGAAEPPSRMLAEELIMIRSSVTAVRPLLPRVPDVQKLLAQQAPAKTLAVTNPQTFVESFQGWTRLTLLGIIQQAEDDFSLDDLYGVCQAAAASQYPENKHVRAKLRQQLQQIRDLGMIEFLGKGMYRKTFVLEKEPAS